jgi:hypothetical protein
VDPTVRSALLIGGLTFCVIFGGMTAAVAIDTGFDVFTVAAIVVLVLLILPLAGALRHPPDE